LCWSATPFTEMSPCHRGCGATFSCGSPSSNALTVWNFSVRCVVRI
jgi:hypothetical protein